MNKNGIRAIDGGTYFEVDFANGLSSVVEVVVVLRIAVARDDAHGLVADDLRPLLGFGVDKDLVGAVNLVVGEDAIL